MIILRMLFRHQLRDSLQEVLFQPCIPVKVIVFDINFDLVIIRLFHLLLQLVTKLFFLSHLCCLTILLDLVEVFGCFQKSVE